jgi:HEAT repeat protein
MRAAPRPAAGRSPQEDSRMSTPTILAVPLRPRACAVAFLALAALAGCVSSSGRPDPVTAQNDALLINTWQEVRAYYDAANRNDLERVRRLKEQLQPRIDANLAVFTDFVASGRNDDERMMAACILGLSGSRKVVPVLLGAMEAPGEGLRHHACLSLGTFGYPGTPAEPVVRLLSDPSAVVRRDATWVLSRILQRGQGCLFVTEEDVLDWMGLVRRLAQEAEGETPAPGRRILELAPVDVRDTVRALAARDSFDDGRRSEVLRALNGAIRNRDLHVGKDFAGVETPDAAKDLLARPRLELADRDVETLNRLLLEAAYPTLLMAARGRERGWALHALLRSLDDEDPLVRCEASIALGRIGSTEAVEPLLRKGLGDTDWRVRLNAASALGLAHDWRAVEPLILVLRETPQNPSIQNAVKFALREITGNDFGGSFTNWKAWWDEQKGPLPKPPGQDEKSGEKKETPGKSEAAPVPAPAPVKSPVPAKGPAAAPAPPAPPTSPSPR